MDFVSTAFADLMNEVCRRIGKLLILFWDEWLIVTLNECLHGCIKMWSSCSFICNRPENPEHSWGYQTVLLRHLLCGGSESRLGAQVSMQKLCKYQCGLFFIDSERTWVYETDWAQLSFHHLSGVFLSCELVSVNFTHEEPVGELGLGGTGPSCCFHVRLTVPCHVLLSGLRCFRGLPTSRMGSASSSELLSRGNTSMIYGSDKLC